MLLVFEVCDFLYLNICSLRALKYSPLIYKGTYEGLNFHWSLFIFKSHICNSELGKEAVNTGERTAQEFIPADRLGWGGGRDIPSDCVWARYNLSKNLGIHFFYLLMKECIGAHVSEIGFKL